MTFVFSKTFSRISGPPAGVLLSARWLWLPSGRQSQRPLGRCECAAGQPLRAMVEAHQCRTAIDLHGCLARSRAALQRTTCARPYVVRARRRFESSKSAPVNFRGRQNAKLD